MKSHSGDLKPQINPNSHTSRFSPIEDEEEFFHEISNAASESLDLKPDPLTLIMGGQGNESRLSRGDDDEDDQFSEPMFRQKRKGGRHRDPIWAKFHLIGGKTWQCNSCSYTYSRPQPDRMKKHLAKCLKSQDNKMMLGIKSDRQDYSQPTSGEGSSSSLGPETTAQPSTTRTATITSESESTTIAGMTQTKTNSITRELKRIADALEESNKLKKLKLGLDPHIPFDGGPKNRK